MAEGHLSQERSNLQSTKKKTKKSKSNIKIDTDFCPTSDFPNVKRHEVVYFLTTTDSSCAYTDLMGKFPVQSSRGNNYVLVAYHYDANAILTKDLKNPETQSIVDARMVINARFKKVGVQPTLYIMDNECSTELKLALKKKSIAWPLVPPHHH